MSDPHAEYETRLGARKTALQSCERRATQLSLFRAVSFVAGVLFGAGAWVWPSVWMGGGVLLAVASFFVFVVAHWRNRLHTRECAQQVRYYEDGLARLEGTWMGRGTAGDVFADEQHPYARDLDLFGVGSLFERLCRARTLAGQTILARWLKQSATPDEVTSRQSAVGALRARVDLREEIAVRASDVHASVHPNALASWATQAPQLDRTAIRIVGALISAVALAGLAGWGLLGWGPLPFAVAALALFGFTRIYRERMMAVLAAAEVSGRELGVLAHVLERFEETDFESPRLVSLQDSLRTEGVSASQRIRQLSRWITALEAMHNNFFVPFGWLLAWRLQCAVGLDSWRRHAGAAVPRWLDAVGELEALSSLATYAFENPADPFPELAEGDTPLVSGTALGHPLIPGSECVTNDIELDGTCRLWVVSGSNMSGKSTFLRTVGVNVVLAQAGAPVRAQSLRLSPLRVGATLRVQDSLGEGISRFYAEIKRLRQIMDLAEAGPTLFLLDEILHGTNSHDRKIGAQAVVTALVERGAVGLVTTHDLALAETAKEMGEVARNVHFEDQLIDGELTFDYTLHEGVVTHSNAIALMRAVGLEV